MALRDVDIGRSIAFHRSHGKLATVTSITPPGRFGVLDIQEAKVHGFREKTAGDGSWINGGFFVPRRKASSTTSTGEHDLGAGADACVLPPTAS